MYEPAIGLEEADAVASAVRAGEISGTFGREVPSFESEFAAYIGKKHGVAVTSGTAALQLAVAALDLEPGSEILVSASTNVATALCAYHNRCVPVPVDSEIGTWNLNLDLLEELITVRTRAIIPVHLYGHPVDMDRMMQIASRHGLVVIEDCAESHGATVRGRMTGSFGDLSCFSFYANKVITTGEGGMVLTDDDSLANRLRLLRNLAFDTPRFYHRMPGHNFRMAGYQAAMGRVQLRRIEHILREKRRVATTYTQLLGDVPGIRLPVELNWAHHIYWMYGVLVTEEAGLSRDELVVGLAERGIEARTFFCPMNRQPFLRHQKGFRDVECPAADRLWEQGCCLPSSPLLAEDSLALVAGEVAALAGSKRAPSTLSKNAVAPASVMSA